MIALIRDIHAQVKMVFVSILGYKQNNSVEFQSHNEPFPRGKFLMIIF